MGKCSECKKKIEYNHFKRYRGKILCYDCYDTRLERKKAKKEEAERLVAEELARKQALEELKVPEEENSAPDIEE